jgi:hypothetical protein
MRFVRQHRVLIVLLSLGVLMVSTFFALVLIPTLYVMFEERFPWRIDIAENEPASPQSDRPAL